MRTERSGRAVCAGNTSFSPELGRGTSSPILAGTMPQPRTILYFHGGAYALGTAALSAGLASHLARRSGTRAVSVDFALAPEHPYPLPGA